MVSSYTLDDDGNDGTSGNNNHRLNPGEVIDLPLYFSNFRGYRQARNISVTMTSDNPRVTVLQSTAVYPNIAPSDSALPLTPFRISASSALQNDEAVVLSLAITADGGSATGAVFLRTEGAAFVNAGLNFPGGPLSPGVTRTLSITLRNSGTLPLTNVTARLQSRSPFVIVSDPDASFGPIASGAQANCNAVSVQPRRQSSHLSRRANPDAAHRQHRRRRHRFADL